MFYERPEHIGSADAPAEAAIAADTTSQSADTAAADSDSTPTGADAESKPATSTDSNGADALKLLRGEWCHLRTPWHSPSHCFGAETADVFGEFGVISLRLPESTTH